MTVGAYAVDWLKDTRQGVRPTTAAFYKSMIGHFAPIADLPLSSLTPVHVRSLLAQTDGAARTRRGVVQTLTQMLKRAQEDGLVDRNVAALVRLPKPDTKEPQRFTPEQARRFLEVSDGDELGSLYRVALGTGLRRGELLALTWRDVDTDKGWISVRRSKTAAGTRIVPLPVFARVALLDRGQRLGPIWPYRPEYVTRHFRELCDRAGVPYITLHGLRHTAASLMLDAGVDPLVIQAILGHTKVSMTSHYARAGEDLRRDAVERLGRAVG